jgi:hypothetical protein
MLHNAASVGSGSGSGDRDPGVHLLPPRTEHAVCSYTVHQQPSACGIRGYGPQLTGRHGRDVRQPQLMQFRQHSNNPVIMITGQQPSLLAP